MKTLRKRNVKLSDAKHSRAGWHKNRISTKPQIEYKENMSPATSLKWSIEIMRAILAGSRVRELAVESRNWTDSGIEGAR
jgi:hypothetical protein